MQDTLFFGITLYEDLSNDIIKDFVKHLLQTVNSSEISNTTEFSSRLPTDNVWLHKFYATPIYSLSESIDNHRQMMQLSMFDMPKAFVYLEADLDLRTKKKTRFLSGVKGTILLPKRFDTGIKKRIIAFCKSAEDKEIALKYGATFFGSTNVIAGIEKGEIRYEDFDHIVCAADTLTDISPIRKFLKEHYPTQKANTLGSDLEGMLLLYKYGYTYESNKLNEANGKVTVPIGTLDMSVEDLQINLQHYIDTFESQRTSRSSNWRFVKNSYVTCPPSVEKFKLSEDFTVPSAKIK
ncbi:DgyrCDS12105 [Dimorphilus gyrociliatus]|uniref:DgyrCDS12105 n=1 Tax=Dimorphilus gyrociliatus TaxID=2664684 RepID=A0A7I8W6B9_9ANNE|nr:DgyrCDS12105 [Dimorphilus gyrociliatus]